MSITSSHTFGRVRAARELACLHPMAMFLGICLQQAQKLSPREALWQRTILTVNPCANHLVRYRRFTEHHTALCFLGDLWSSVGEARDVKALAGPSFWLYLDHCFLTLRCAKQKRQATKPL